MGVNNLPRVVTWQRLDQVSNPRPLDRKSDAITVMPPSNAVEQTKDICLQKSIIVTVTFQLNGQSNSMTE